MLRPSHSIASSRQESCGSPSTSTAQAPHSPSSQPCLVPVRARSSRSTSSSVLYGANEASTVSPLTLRLSCTLRRMHRLRSGGPRVDQDCSYPEQIWRYSTPKAPLAHRVGAAVRSHATTPVTVVPPENTHMTLRIGDEAPNFKAETTQGSIDFHQWIGNGYAVLFSHPKDFTPVCTTELGTMGKMKSEFDKRNTKIIGLSVDPVNGHERWAKDIEETQGTAPNYPIIGDADLKISKLYDMLPAEATPGKRTAADNQTVRTVFVVGPDKKVKLVLYYPMTTGRNFDEVLRVLDSIQLTAKYRVATPANWKQGQDVIIAGSVSDDEAKKLFPQGWKSPKPYLRITQQPK